MKGYTANGFFPIILQRNTTFVTSCLLSCSKKGCTLREKNWFLRKEVFFKELTSKEKGDKKEKMTELLPIKSVAIHYNCQSVLRNLCNLVSFSEIKTKNQVRFENHKEIRCKDEILSHIVRLGMHVLYQSPKCKLVKKT